MTRIAISPRLAIKTLRMAKTLFSTGPRQRHRRSWHAPRRDRAALLRYQYEIYLNGTVGDAARVPDRARRARGRGAGGGSRPRRSATSPAARAPSRPRGPTARRSTAGRSCRGSCATCRSATCRRRSSVRRCRRRSCSVRSACRGSSIPTRSSPWRERRQTSACRWRCRRCRRTRMEDVAAAGGDSPQWFQLYWPKDREVGASLLARAKAAGFSALLLTLDTFILAWRPRDLVQRLPAVPAAARAGELRVRPGVPRRPRRSRRRRTRPRRSCTGSRCSATRATPGRTWPGCASTGTARSR